MSLAVSFSNIVEMFHHLVIKYGPTKKAYLMRKRNGAYVPITYTEVADQVLAFSAGLAELGIRHGDRVAILAENRPEWVVADLGILAQQCTGVPIFPSQTAKQVEFIVEDSGAVAIVVSNPLQLSKAMKVKEALRGLKHIIVMNDIDGEAQPHVTDFRSLLRLGRASKHFDANLLRKASEAIRGKDMCTIIYTSGTTGNPKGVMLTHANFVSNISSSSQVLPIHDTDMLLSFLPLCHVFERMAGYYTVSACGATIAYAESIDTVADNMIEVKPTIVVAVPRLFERMYNRIAKRVEKDAPAKRKIFYWAIGVGRAAVQARKRGRVPIALRAKQALADKLVFSKLKERMGGRIRYYVSGGAALPRELGEFFEACGLIIIEGYGLTESSPVIAANRLDEYRFGSVGRAISGVEVRIAEDGEILARGPNIMVGYYNNKKATEEAIDKDGWLHTGDIGLIDESGILYITDRKKHLFVSSGGKNIAPQHIESMFAGQEFIDQFVLIGDKRMYLTALIVPDYDVLRAYADEHGIPYKDKIELTRNSEIYKIIEARIQATQKDLANFEKVRRFTLLDEPFSIENGLMTPSLKIRRKIVEERYQDLINSMYQT